MKPEKRDFQTQHQNLLNTLSLEQLYWLNEMAVDRIRLLEKLDDLAATSNFRRGNKVTWEYQGCLYTGRVVRVNHKTLSVAETQEPYRKWKIAPQLATIIEA